MVKWSNRCAVGCSPSQQPQQRIDWDDYNYPPVLRMWHYEPLELEPAPRFVSRAMEAAFIVPVGTLVLNIPVTIALVAMERLDGLCLMYSFFNFIIGGLAGLWAFMTGYQGIGKKKHSAVRKYLIEWALLICLMFLPCFLAFINFNGWVRVNQLSHETEGKGRTFWLAASVIESILWTVSIVLGIAAWACTYQVGQCLWRAHSQPVQHHPAPSQVHQHGPLALGRLARWMPDTTRGGGGAEMSDESSLAERSISRPRDWRGNSGRNAARIGAQLAGRV